MKRVYFFLQKLENRRTNSKRVVWTQCSPLNRRRRGQDKREQSSWQTFSRTNLTCFTAPSLKQAFASEMDEVRQAKYLRLCLWCDCPTDVLSIIASGELLCRPLAAEQSNSLRLHNLSGNTGALRTGTCFSAVSAQHTWGPCRGPCLGTSRAFVFCLPAAHDSRPFLH